MAESISYKSFEVLTPVAKEWLYQHNVLSDVCMQRLAAGDPRWHTVKDPRKPKEIKLIDKISSQEERLLKRRIAGRSRGAGAGGFNRDVDHILHTINLLNDELVQYTTKGDK